jgi:hypothetical protein
MTHTGRGRRRNRKPNDSCMITAKKTYCTIQFTVASALTKYKFICREPRAVKEGGRPLPCGACGAFIEERALRP